MIVDEQIAKELHTQSKECERGIIGIGADRITGEPICALALIGPHCVLFTQPVVPEREIFIDICLN